MPDPRSLTTIGVFYDGNYFSRVSTFYGHHHARRARLSVAGLHRFVRHEVAKREGQDIRYCQIVESHYFRGRLTAHDAANRNMLEKERNFDDSLMREGVATHYTHLSGPGDRTMDVWFVLEALELTVQKRFDIVVLVTGREDYLPLVRKLNALGTRVMVLAWGIDYTNPKGKRTAFKLSQRLLDEVPYPLRMNELIGDGAQHLDPVINGMFYPSKHLSSGYGGGGGYSGGSNYSGGSSYGGSSYDDSEPAGPPPEVSEDEFFGYIHLLRNGFGFIEQDHSESNLYFFYRELANCRFSELEEGMRVRYRISSNDKGPCAVEIYAEDLSYDDDGDEDDED